MTGKFMVMVVMVIDLSVEEVRGGQRERCVLVNVCLSS